ncbi:MAG: alr0857 family protein [Cyanobacteria bacterium P01_E01_bin.6]
MLKVIYTETGQYLEHTSSTLQCWMICQHRLANQVGDRLSVEHCTASILLPADTRVITMLESITMNEVSRPFIWEYADLHTIEVVFSGLWVSPDANGHEGTVLVEVGDRIAVELFHLWADAAKQMSTISQ